MSTFFLTKKAKQDLIEIAKYTEATWGISERNAYLLKLDNAFQNLAQNPRLGQIVAIDELSYRRHPIGQHTVFFREQKNRPVLIVRILHQRMDPDIILTFDNREP